MSHIVKVAWNREAADIAEQKGFEILQKKSGLLEKQHNMFISYDEIPFNTKAEAVAYCKGIEDGNGWDKPYYEIQEPATMRP